MIARYKTTASVAAAAALAISVGAATPAYATPGFYLQLNTTGGTGDAPLNQFFVGTLSGGQYGASPSAFTFDGYSLQFTFGTNFSGSNSAGQISESVQISGSGNGTTTGFSANLSITDSNSQTTAQTFTLPTGSNFALVSSPSVSASVQGETITVNASSKAVSGANSTTTTNSPIVRNASTTGSSTLLVNGGYTLSNQLVFSNFSSQVTGVPVQITSSIQALPAPEPATFAILGVGLVGLGLARRRRA